MPIIKITQSDIDRSKPPSEGWHLGKIEKFSSDKSKDKQSDNWVFDVVITEEGENKGRYMFGRFNSKAPGMLVSSGFIPGALDQSADSFTELEFNPEELIGKELYGECKKSVYEGKIQSRTETWATASKPPF